MKTSLIIVLAWLMLFATALAVAGYNLDYLTGGTNKTFRLTIECALIGGLGGFLYCLRGTYLNHSARGKWDEKWVLWYFVRPLASIICGGISMVFLKAGLLLLEANDKTAASNFGFYAFAFIAGINVDNFIRKLEDVALTTWGIQKTRTSGILQQEESRQVTPPQGKAQTQLEGMPGESRQHDAEQEGTVADGAAEEAIRRQGGEL